MRYNPERKFFRFDIFPKTQLVFVSTDFFCIHYIYFHMHQNKMRKQNKRSILPFVLFPHLTNFDGIRQNAE